MVFDSVVKVVAEYKEIPAEKITMDTTFEELGIDSLDTVEMVMNLEDMLGVEIKTDEEMKTVGELVKMIESSEKKS